MAAVALERAEQCSSCGTAQHVWDEDPYAYEPMRFTCTGCMKRELMQADDTPVPKGTSVRLVPKAVAERLTFERERKEAEGTLRPTRRR